MTHQKKPILILSSCPEDWGGSEELWAKSIPFFQEQGYEVTVTKIKVNFTHPKFIALQQNGVRLHELSREEKRIPRILKRNWNKVKLELGMKIVVKDPFEELLRELKPSFVVISQGINFDGLCFGCVCAKFNIPYFIVCQKAVDFYWPPDRDRGFMTESLLHASKCFFVSQHNKRLTEEQFGIKLDNSQVIYNPSKLRREILKFPEIDQQIRLACIGRLFLLDKGQDMLIRIMAKPKWRERNISISFFGEGMDKTGLEAMVKFYQLDNIHFRGYTHDVAQIWAEHHALVLPSRSEGMPLVVLESMSVGRICITSNAGGNAEIVEDNRTGFVGTSCEEGIEDALERAWQQVHQWEEMGQSASRHINNTVPGIPEREFTKIILESL